VECTELLYLNDLLYLPIGQYILSPFISFHMCLECLLHTTVYPKVSGLAARSENYKRYSSLPLGAVVSLFCEPV